MGGIAVSGVATGAGAVALGGGAAMIAKGGCPDREGDHKASKRRKDAEKQKWNLESRVSNPGMM